ncbi:MAG TPA: HD domain-containing protein [Longimicrobiales bacterium]
MIRGIFERGMELAMRDGADCPAGRSTRNRNEGIEAMEPAERGSSLRVEDCAATRAPLAHRRAGPEVVRVEAGARAQRESSGWLDLVERSYMGSAHARRVGRLALALAESIPGVERRLEIRDLLVAAWSHELGRATAAEPVPIAVQGARMLAELGSAAGIVESVAHLAERHDGMGGPGGRSGDAIPLISQIVSVADAIEHGVVAALSVGMDAVEAVDRALAHVATQRGTAFRPEVADAARRQRSRLITICADCPAGPTPRSTAAA